MRRVERNTIGFLGFSAAFFTWQMLSLSSRVAARDPALGEWIIAYFGWGALAGGFAGLFPVYAYYVAKAAPALSRSTAPAVELRRRPAVLFVMGLAMMTILWNLISTAALVLSGSEIPWAVAYWNGYFTGLVLTVALGYAIFLSNPFSSMAGAPSP